MELVISNTPWEVYDVDGVLVHVKREDLCCIEPGPSFSKIRGVERYIANLPVNGDEIGVVDTRHSKAGWGVAYICQHYDRCCVDFYPVLKADTGLREYQQRVLSFGAELYPMKAEMSAVLYNRAKTIMKQRGGIILPNGLRLQESIDATADELANYTPKELMAGTWVVSISSGTLGSGVMTGLKRCGFRGEVVLHMGYSHSQSSIRQFADSLDINMTVIDEGYEYKDKVDNSWIPFPCNEHYDAKAFTWLAHNVKKLKQPVVFWNIGA